MATASACVAAATVFAVPSMRPASTRRFVSAWMPPAWYRSSTCTSLAGASLQRCGTRAATSLMRCSGNSSPASVAIAARWSTVFVLQPKLASSASALPITASVTMSRGLRPFVNTSMTAMPAALARRRRAEYTAGTVPLPGSARPSTSARQFMELAVNMPEHEPHVGQAAHSIASSPSSSSSPAMWRPTPSKTVFRSIARSPCRPASMGPPPTITAGMSSRIAAMSMPGTILSQHGTSTRASNAWPLAIDSTLSATSSRLGRE